MVIGEKAEHFSAVWVKNEWSRFLSLMRKDRTKLLLPCYKNVDPYDLPEQLGVLQSYDMGKIGFMQDLIRGIRKVLQKDEPKETVKETVVVPQSAGGANLTAQLKRGQQALEDRDWAAADGFFDKALDMDAECAEAFFGKALAAHKVSSGDALVSLRLAQEPEQREAQTLTACERDEERAKAAAAEYALPGYLEEKDIRALFGYDTRTYSSLTQAWKARIAREPDFWKSDRNLSRAVRYAKGDFAETLRTLQEETNAGLRKKLAESEAADKTATAETVRRYQEELAKAEEQAKSRRQSAEDRREKEYLELCERQEKADSESDYSYTASGFETDKLRSYKDCADRAKQCREAIQRLRAEADAAAKRKKKKTRNITITVFAVLVVIIAAALVVTQVVIPKQKLDKANRLRSAGEYEAAIALYKELGRDDLVLEMKPEYHQALFSKAEAGSYVFFGSYEQDNEISNGAEDIEWLVLNREGNKLLVISRYALDCQPYNTPSASVTWEKCTLRNWLNNAFFNAAFSAEEQAMIPAVMVSADKNPDSDTNPGKSTKDKVFLLSILEVDTYFADNEARKCKPTTYAEERGCDNHNDSCRWWLRSPGFSSFYAAVFDSDGFIRYGGSLVNIETGAIRPAMWISLDS